MVALYYRSERGREGKRTLEKLKNYRQFRGFSRDKLAAMVGISSETLARYERGEREPTTTVTKKLAAALGVTPNELLGVTDEKSPGA